MAGLYIHIPFCRRKCPYCDFYSVTDDRGRLAVYPDLLCRHLELEQRRGFWAEPFETVFFGGGTPSLLDPSAIGRILETVQRSFGLDREAEISLEANPGTVSLESLAGYRAAGVNRLSLGVQSLRAASLRRLGRIHSPAEARDALHWARRAGFENLSADLMFALPGQTPADLRAELRELTAFGVDHLSCYGLTVEEETPFYHLHRAGGLEPPGEEAYSDLYIGLGEQLRKAGYEHYEISNFARPGFACRHNLRYWERRPYLGIGAGAHSFVDRGWGERRAVPGDLQLYAEKLGCGEDPSGELERFGHRGAMAETLYLGLRTAAGVAETVFRRRFGTGVAAAFPEAVQRCEGWLRHRDDHWIMSSEGWLLYDHLISFFL